MHIILLFSLVLYNYATGLLLQQDGICVLNQQCYTHL